MSTHYALRTISEGPRLVAVDVVTFGLAWWLGLYLLARDPRKPLLWWAGAGMIGYSAAVVVPHPVLIGVPALALAPLATPTQDAAAAALPSGGALVAGGLDAAGSSQSSGCWPTARPPHRSVARSASPRGRSTST